MKKIVCDICGKDALEEEFILPCYNRYYAMNRGVKVAAFEQFETCKFNLCDNCKIVIADMISVMRKI